MRLACRQGVITPVKLLLPNKCVVIFFSFLTGRKDGRKERVLAPDSRPRICSPLAWRTNWGTRLRRSCAYGEISTDVYRGFVHVVFVVNGCCRWCCRQSTPAEYRARNWATKRVCVCADASQKLWLNGGSSGHFRRSLRSGSELVRDPQFTAKVIVANRKCVYRAPRKLVRPLLHQTLFR